MIMKITIDYTKSAQENADYFYKRSKKLAMKRAGAEASIINLEKRLGAAKVVTESTQKKRIKVTEKEWYQKFHWFYTSDGLLVIAGRDAQQNELLNSKYFEGNDLFFHANIFGAAVTILKEGIKAGKEAREEAAQFAACYSSAWKDGLPAVDVYAMRRNQVSKSASKGSLSSGSFLLSGEREWYKNTGLSLVLFIKDERLNATPEACFYRLKEAGKVPDTYVLVKQGKMKKSDAAKKISKSLEFPDIDTIMQQLPAGEFRTAK